MTSTSLLLSPRYREDQIHLVGVGREGGGMEGGVFNRCDSEGEYTDLGSLSNVAPRHDSIIREKLVGVIQ